MKNLTTTRDPKTEMLHPSLSALSLSLTQSFLYPLQIQNKHIIPGHFPQGFIAA